MTQSGQLKGPKLRTIDARFMVLYLAIFGLTVAQSDDISDERIRLNVRAKFVAPNMHSMKSWTIISTLSQDDVNYFEKDPYRLSLLVTDKRLGEFSMEVTIFDHTGTARDSLTLLASLKKEGSFEFLFDDVAISGTVRIVEIMQSRVDRE